MITNTPGTVERDQLHLSYQNGTLSVGQAVLTVTVNSATRIYGATNPVFTVIYSGFINGDSTNIFTGKSRS